MRGKRIHWIDIAKGICIISVIAGHLGVVEINKIVFSFHLTVFFILSGYTLKKTKLSNQYISSKFKRLMTPYFVTAFCVYLMKIINSIVIYKDASIKTITHIISQGIFETIFSSGSVNNLANFEIDSIGAIWFLPAMFFSILFVQWLLNTSLSEKKIFLISVLVMLFSWFSAKLIWLPFSLQSGIFSSPFLLIGYYLKEYRILSKLDYKYILLGMFALCVGYTLNVSQIFFVSASLEDLMLTPAISLVVSISVLLISIEIDKNKILEWYGKNSIYVLCIHLFELNTMYPYYTMIFEQWGGYKKHILIFFVIKILFITLALFGVLAMKNKLQRNIKFLLDCEEITPDYRNPYIDVTKGFLIILMLVGHFSIDENLRTILYSFHMPAFIIFSGYFYKNQSSNLRQLGKSIRKLIISYFKYFCLFALPYILMNYTNIPMATSNLLYGISFEKNIIFSANTIGPIYFLYLLFIIRLLYQVISYFFVDAFSKNMVIIVLSAFGFFLGDRGYWLPWSFDCALVCLLFYHLGYLLNKYKVLDILGNSPYYYFMLSFFFFMFVLTGGMELAVREYNDLGIMLIGSISGTLLLYMLVEYIYNVSPRLIKNFLKLIGRSTIYILIIHALLKKYITDTVCILFSLDGNFIYAITISMVVQIILGLIAYCLINLNVFQMYKHKTSE